MDMYLKICFCFCYRELAYEFVGLVKQIDLPWEQDGLKVKEETVFIWAKPSFP